MIESPFRGGLGTPLHDISKIGIEEKEKEDIVAFRVFRQGALWPDEIVRRKVQRHGVSVIVPLL